MTNTNKPKYGKVHVHKEGLENTPDAMYSYDSQAYEKRKESLLLTHQFKISLEEENLYQFINVIFNKIDLGYVDIARAIALSAWLNKKNILIKDSKPMVKEDIDDILMISVSERNKLLNRLETHSIIYIYKNRIEYNKEYFVNGKCISTNYSRMFTKTISEIYNFCDKNSLAYVYKVLRFVSFNHNVLCHNPSAKSGDRIEPLTWDEFAKALNWKSFAKFKSKMKKLETADGEAIFLSGKIGTQEVIYINPRIAYRNRNSETFKTLLSLFRIGDVPQSSKKLLTL